MDYLKCNKCGHLNKLQTEYQTFCSDCKMKLDNNYSDWKRRNPEKSFDDFKQTECISDEQIAQAKKDMAKPNKKHGLKYYIVLIISIALFSAVGKYGGEIIYSLFNSHSFDKAMMEAASKINESCPIMVDSETRLDNAIAMPDNVFQYNYTLIHVDKDSIDIDLAKGQLEPTIINFVKTNPDLKIYRDSKVTFKYYYKDRNGVYLLSILVPPDIYLN